MRLLYGIPVAVVTEGDEFSATLTSRVMHREMGNIEKWRFEFVYAEDARDLTDCVLAMDGRVVMRAKG